MQHLREEVKKRLEARRNSRWRRWSLWMRNLILLLAVAMLIRYLGGMASPVPPQDTPIEIPQEDSL